LRGWVRQAERDQGKRAGPTSDDRERVKALERDVHFAQRVRDRLAQADWHFRRDLIRLLVKRVEIDHNQVNIVFRVAPTFPVPEEIIGREGSVLPDCRRGGRARFRHPAPILSV
jgi:hypothetical protein